MRRCLPSKSKGVEDDDDEINTKYGHLLQVSPSGKIRRPPNAFMLFAREHRREVSQKNPNRTNKCISALLGQAWKDFPPEEKSVYYNLASKLDSRHKEMYPNYTYNPKLARQQKRIRARVKSEKTMVKDNAYKHPRHHSDTEAYSRNLTETANACSNSNSDTRSRNPLPFPEREFVQYPFKECDLDCDNISKPASPAYKPPDLGPQRYPISGAMDDPPQPPSDVVQRMRRIAENLSGVTSHPEHCEVSSVQVSPDVSANEQNQIEHKEGVHQPMSQVRLASWNEQPPAFMYGRQYSIPCQVPSDNGSRHSGNMDNNHFEERQIVFHRGQQHPYRQMAPCDFSTYEFPGPYMAPRQCFYTQLYQQSGVPRPVMYHPIPAGHYVLPAIIPPRVESPIGPPELPVNYQLAAHRHASMINNHPHNYMSYGTYSHGFHHQMLPGQLPFYSSLLDWRAELEHNRRIVYNQPASGMKIGHVTTLGSDEGSSTMGSDQHLNVNKCNDGSQNIVVDEPVPDASNEVEVVSDCVHQDSSDEICLVD